MLYRFADFELDEARREIRRGGEPLRVEPKVFEFVLHLVRNRGRVVSKEELVETLWPGQEVLGGALATCVHRARALLGDARCGPIRNRPRVGYEFVASVDVVGGTEHPARPRLVGREHELGRAGSLLDEAAAGNQRTWILVGEPGIGKTTLLGEAMREARRRGFRTWWIDAAGDAGDDPFGLWRELLREHASESDWQAHGRLASGREHARYLREWIDGGPTGTRRSAAPPDGSQLRERLFRAVVDFLRLASASPLAVAIDDLHNADAPSLRLLTVLTQELSDTPLLVAAASRTSVELAGSRPPRSSGTNEVQLGPLPRSAVATVLSSELGGGPISDKLVDDVVSRVGGNPLFVIELTRHLERRGLLEWSGDEWTSRRPLDRMRLPSSVRGVVANRLRQLAPSTRHVVGAAALLGNDFDIAVLAEVLAVPPGKLRDSVRKAMAAGILEPEDEGENRYRFGHPLVQNACAETLGDEEQRRLHRQTAMRLDARKAPAAQVARHLLAAVDDKTAPLAMETCETAGLEALGKLAFEQAAEWFTRAAELAPLAIGDDPARIASLWFAAAEALMLAGDEPAARRAFWKSTASSRETSAPPPDEGVTGGADHLLTMFRLGREMDLADSTDALQAFSERREAVEHAIDVARARGDVTTMAPALVARRWTAAVTAGPQERLRLSTEAVFVLENSARRELLFEAGLLRVHDLLECGRIGEADREILALLRAAKELANPVFDWIAAYLRAMTAQREGRLEESLATAQEAFNILAPLAPAEALMTLTMNFVAVHGGRGTLADLVGMLEAAALQTPRNPIVRATLAGAYADAGRIAETRREVEAATDALDRSGVFLTAFASQTAAGLARPCRVLGDRERAAFLYEHLLPWRGLHLVVPPAAGYTGPADAYLGVLADTLGRWRDAAEHYEASIDACDAAHCPQIRAHTQYEYARGLLARGGDVRAHAAGLHLREAEATARRLGLTGLLGWVEALPRA